MKKTTNFLFFLSVIFFLIACDPHLHGTLRVFNETDSTLFFYSNDSTIITIKPESNELIYVIDRMGKNKNYDCCPCEFDTLKIYSSIGAIKKDPNVKENWEIPNKSELKAFGGGEGIKCEFHISKTDI